MYGDVFISHHQSDSAARDLKEQLDLIGIHPFYSTDDLYAGNSLKPEIESAIRSCKVFVLVQTFDEATEWICNEVTAAHKLDKPLVRVCTNTTTVPKNLLLDFGDRRYISAIPPDEEHLKKAAAEISEILEVEKKKQIPQTLSNLAQQSKKISRRFICALVLIAVLAPVVAWFILPKQLDPDYKLLEDGTLVLEEFPYRAAMRNFSRENPPKWASDPSDADNIRHVVISKKITTIGNFAFEACVNLETVTLQEKITSIGESAFHDCKKLEKLEYVEESEDLKVPEHSITPDDVPQEDFDIVIPNSVTKIKASAFSGCENLKSVYISDSVIEIQQLTFANCISLMNVRMSRGVTFLGKSTFAGCSALKEAELPSSVTSVKGSLFSGCGKLERVEILGNVTEIEESAFDACVALRTVNFHSIVTKIGDCAFRNCPTLSEINGIDSVTKIGEMAFQGCHSLSEISINSVKEIGSMAFEECPALTKVRIPDSAVKIGADAFKNCKNLAEISLPQTFLQNVGANAFPYETANFKFRPLNTEAQTPSESADETSAPNESEFAA